MFGVTPPSSTLNSDGRMVNFLTVSQRSSLALASPMKRSIVVRSSGDWVTSA